MSAKALTHNEYTVGWICALSKELTAATAMLDEIHQDLSVSPNDHNAYTLGRVGEHNVVLACLPKGEIGNNNAATVATRMTLSFPSIKFGLMVGIGGGVPKHVRLGDVVVSTPTMGFGGVVQWDMGKAKQGNTFERTGALNSPPGALLTALTKLERDHEMKGSKIPEYLEDLNRNWPKLVPKYARSESLKDVLFKADYTHVDKGSNSGSDTPGSASEEEDEGDEGDEGERGCINCDQSKIIKRKAREMRIHYGLIASGNQVIKDASRRDELNKRLGGKVLCFEMEAAGLMNDFPCIIIRGICDYADSHKNDSWQEHAAAVAAAFAKEFLSVIPTHAVDQLPTIKDLYDHVTHISEGVDKLIRQQAGQEHQAIFEWLTPIEYSSQQSDLISKRQKGTGEWLLNSAEFQKWVSEAKQTLYCPGIPGAGKTVMAAVVVDDLITRYGDDPDVGIAYIYCSYQPRQEQKSEYLLASLLKQLAQQRLEIPSEVKNLYERCKISGTRPSLDEVVLALQSTITLFSRVFIIIDALDEYHTSSNAKWKQILVLKEPKFQSSCRINLFVTSRFISEVSSEFSGCMLQEIRAKEGDIYSFVDENIPQFRAAIQLSERQDIQDNIRQSIVKAASGMFLLAKLLVDSLQQMPTLGHILELLENLSHGESGLTEMYQIAMERIEAQEDGCRELAKQILCWVTYAKRALSTKEVQHAVAVHVQKTHMDTNFLPEVKVLGSLCAGLITVDKNSDIVRLVHYTTREYFERAASFPNAHEEIASKCIAYLSFDDFASGFCDNDEEFDTRLRENPLYVYAARYWGHHARDASMEPERLIPYLTSEAKVSASGQALMVFSRNRPNYSQMVPKLTGVHLAAYFGLKEPLISLFEHGYKSDTADRYGQTPLWYAVLNGYEAVVELLLNRGADPDSEDIDGRTLLSYAAERGREAVVKLLLARSQNPDCKTFDKCHGGRTPLSFAASSNNEAVVKLLLADEMIDAASKDSSYRTPLCWAAERGHKAVVNMLLAKGVDSDPMDICKRTPLSFAAENGHHSIVELLLEEGANPHSKDLYGRTPLSYAVCSEKQAVVERLLREGVSLNAADNDGRTALCFAAGSGQEAMVKFLLAQDSILPDASDNGGRTPLLLAARRGYDAVVLLLLENGHVDVDHQDSAGWTPLLSAAEQGHKAAVRQLIENDANLELRDKDLRTPLLCAAENGHLAVVELLIESGVDVSASDAYKRTLLWWAAEKGYETLVQRLLKRRECQKFKDSKDSKYGQTPLSCAAEKGHEVVVKLLLVEGAAPDSYDKDSRTPLSWATENRHEAIVRLLLEEDGVNPDSRDINGRTPLSYAAWTGELVSVQLLLEKGRVDINSRDTRSQTPLFFATEKGHEAIIRLLLEKNANINSKGRDVQALLFIAVKRSNEEMIRLLLENGADVDWRDRDSCTPICYATNGTIAKLLLGRGADVNVMGRGGTPLFNAVRQGAKDVVEMLLEQGADANEKNSSGRTPLSYATNCDIARLLLQNGANVDAADRLAGTPVIYAVENGNEPVARLLLDYGADINSKDNTGNTPLFYARVYLVAKMLVEKGANVNAKNAEGQTPLMFAVRRWHEPAARLFLDHDADIDSEDSTGMTALFFAVMFAQRAIVKLLLNRGANPNARNRNGETPLLFALSRLKSQYANDVEQLKPVIELLIERGADVNAKCSAGRSPLSYALGSGSEALSKLLIDKRAEIGHAEGLAARVRRSALGSALGLNRLE